MRQTLEVQSQGMQFTIETQGRQVSRLVQTSEKPLKGLCVFEKLQIAFGGLTAIFSKPLPKLFFYSRSLIAEPRSRAQVLARHPRLAPRQAVVPGCSLRRGSTRHHLWSLSRDTKNDLYRSAPSSSCLGTWQGNAGTLCRCLPMLAVLAVRQAARHVSDRSGSVLDSEIPAPPPLPPQPPPKQKA